VPGENDKMKDTVTRDKLLEARKVIVKEYEATILDWSEYFHAVSEQTFPWAPL